MHIRSAHRAGLALALAAGTLLPGCQSSEVPVVKVEGNIPPPPAATQDTTKVAPGGQPKGEMSSGDPSQYTNP